MLFASVGAALADSAKQSRPKASGPLDGMSFVGRIGPQGQPDLDDTIYFNDGQFWSAACTRCGFAPAPYWARRVGDAIEFRGTLESPERGVFTYVGVVRDGRLSTEINWRRDRWYWSIDRDLRFVGTLAGPDKAAMTVQSAIVVAAGPSPDPERCPR